MRKASEKELGRGGVLPKMAPGDTSSRGRIGPAGQVQEAGSDSNDAGKEERVRALPWQVGPLAPPPFPEWSISAPIYTHPLKGGGALPAWQVTLTNGIPSLSA